jgi:hypothetical protein
MLLYQWLNVPNWLELSVRKRNRRVHNSPRRHPGESRDPEQPLRNIVFDALPLLLGPGLRRDDEWGGAGMTELGRVAPAIKSGDDHGETGEVVAMTQGAERE